MAELIPNRLRVSRPSSLQMTGHQLDCTASVERILDRLGKTLPRALSARFTCLALTLDSIAPNARGDTYRAHEDIDLGLHLGKCAVVVRAAKPPFPNIDVMRPTTVTARHGEYSMERFSRLWPKAANATVRPR